MRSWTAAQSQPSRNICKALTLGRNFPELDTGFVSLDSVVDIVSDGTLKTTFREKSLPDYWVQIQPWHSELADTALKRLMPFPTTYNCDIGFSSLVGLKVRQCNRINVESDLRIKLSSLEPDIVSLMSQHKQHHTVN
ncbi:zinc finger BED domain-containing protein 5-like protein [Lates japonicus]|uniref:Zinc finger BED domain-containing protein 5-like protein n=1 Tax=Lates japonicus TaxID=270547 RepID=A0AAD3R0R3_LATJO|nr:zinc finger BED domain-containing protein 5-like protein [Lates japonicus]